MARGTQQWNGGRQEGTQKNNDHHGEEGNSGTQSGIWAARAIVAMGASEHAKVMG